MEVPIYGKLDSVIEYLSNPNYHQSRGKIALKDKWPYLGNKGSLLSHHDSKA